MNSLPSASIVLCTYQGEKFLCEQLESLRAQTVAPLEIIARDDGSTDSTLEILAGEAKTNSRFTFKKNVSRMGFAQNFASACADAKGDILFLCDQDDLWEPEKIEVLLKKFALDPSLAMACSEATFLGSDTMVLSGNGMNEFEMQHWEQGAGFPDLVRRNPVPGMTMALRREFLRTLLPVPEGWEHDYWMLLLTAGLGKNIAVERRPLVKYRQHDSQTLGGERTFGDRWRKAEGQTLRGLAAEARKFTDLRIRLEAVVAPAPNSSLARAKEEHLLRRSRFSSGRMVRAVEIGRELASGGYHRFGAGISTAVKDWLASS